MNTSAIAHHLDIIDWTVLFKACDGADAMYEKFSNLCRSLIVKFTPVIDNRSGQSRFAKTIARVESRAVRFDPVESPIHKRLVKASTRLRSLTESCINFKDAKALFRYANSRIKSHDVIPALVSGDGTISDDHGKAATLASHFSSMFTSQTPPSLSSPCISPPTIVADDIPLHFSESLVYHHLSNLQAKCSLTPDSIPPCFYKEFALFICEPLSLIYAKSYSTSEVPRMFRRSVVTPIHKKGSKALPANYRPVSQCSVSSLIFEKILANQLVSHLRANDLFDPGQHGFVPKRSNLTQLISMTRDWACYLNERKAFHCIYYDQKAAFDRINHDLLINKLVAIGVHQQTCDWLRSFLSNRSFKVRVGCAFSDYVPLQSYMQFLYLICPVTSQRRSLTYKTQDLHAHGVC